MYEAVYSGIHLLHWCRGTTQVYYVYPCMNRGFKIYHKEELPYWGKNTPKYKFSAVLQPNFPLNRILSESNRIEFEVKRWKTTHFLENGYFLTPKCNSHKSRSSSKNSLFTLFCGRACEHIASLTGVPPGIGMVGLEVHFCLNCKQKQITYHIKLLARQLWNS